jgi:hypothetical protein
MKDYKYLLLFSFILLSCGNAQEKNKDSAMKKTEKEIVISQESVEIDSLDTFAKNDWKKIDITFLNSTYATYLNEHNLHQNCIQCGNILLDYECLIDSDGKVSKISLHGSDIECKGMTDSAKREMEDAFLQYFKNIVYPASLSGKFIFFTVGQAMKC